MFSNEKKNILAALFELQKEMYVEKVFFTKSADNPFYKSKYMPLPQLLQVIVPRLHKHGMLLSQHSGAVYSAGVVSVETVISHVSSGEFVSSVFASTAPDPQKAGAVITYGKRYGLEALLGVPTIDDDAESAMDRTKSAGKKSQKIQPVVKEGCLTTDQQTEIADLCKNMSKESKVKLLKDYEATTLADIKQEHYKKIKEEVKR
jgi:hypothetical protein